MDAAVDDERVTELLNAHEYDFFVIAPGDTQCCSVLQCVAVCYSDYLLFVIAPGDTQCPVAAVFFRLLQCILVVCCSVLQCVAVYFFYNSRR